MIFKDYVKLVEQGKKYSSDKILTHVSLFRIPILTKDFEKIFGKQKSICFQAMRFNRIPSLMKRQHKRNSVSTFTSWDTPNIFWGAKGAEWLGSDLTAVAVLEGNVSMKFPMDGWTHIGSVGRRWIDVNDLHDNHSHVKLSKVLKKLKEYVFFHFTKKIKNYDDGRFIDYISLDSSYREVKFSADLKNNDEAKQFIIESYFDITTAAFKKYKYEIEEAMRDDLKDDYNEVLCYNYKVKEINILLSDGYYDNVGTQEDLDYLNDILKSNNIKVKINYFTKIKDLEKHLKSWQKKNKGIK